MSDRSRRPRGVVVVLVVAYVLAAAVAPAGVVAGLDGGHTDGAATPSVASSVAATATVDATPATDAVGPELRSANGTVEVVVRFAGDAGPRPSAAADGTAVSTDELRTAAESAQDAFERFAERKPGVAVERRFWLANAMLVTVDTESVAVERLLDVRGVERVHENFRVELNAPAGDGGAARDARQALAGPERTPAAAASTSANATYGVDAVRAPEVWEAYGTRGGGATVAVLDTGIEHDHPDLTVSGWAAFDATGALVSEGVENASDADGHGTHVAGTVAGGNASGTAIGVAPEAHLYGVKVLDDTGSGTYAQVVAGMEHATDDPDVDVLQMSLGAEGQFDEFIEPVQNARDAGKLVVASAGNSGSGTSSSPGNVYDSFAVGAVDADRDVAPFSGGETLNTSADWDNETLTADWPAEYVVPDASAPGVNVYSAEPSGGYVTESGTSMAAPHVSGVAALMIAATARDVTDEELSATLRDTADHPDGTSADARYGAGVVDAFAAVEAVAASNLSVTAFDAPSETVPGATLEATATVNNTGADTGTGTVEYRFDGAVGDAANVSLAPGENATVSFAYVVPSDTQTNATYEHGAYTADSNLTAAVDVADAPRYAVTGLAASGLVGRNATLDAAANVTNVGSTAGENRTVELRLADPGNGSDVRVLDAANVSLGAGDTASTALNGAVPSDFVTGETTLEIASPDDNATATVRVADAVGTVSGTVTDAETNATLPAVDVVVRNGTEAVGETTTDGNGTYAVDVPATDLTVTASSATYAPSTASATLNGSGDAATANLSLRLRNGTLSGAVGASDGLGAPSNATVTVRDGTGAVVATVDADPNGSYEVTLAPATYDLTADAQAFDAANATNVTVGPNATTTRDFGLDPRPATLSGVVTAADGGDPIENATVTVETGTDPPTAATAATGTYSLTAPRGDYRVAVTADGYRDAARRLTLPANGSVAADFALATPPEFLVDRFSGPSPVERGADAAFDAEVRNAGGVRGDATVTFAVPRTGTTRSTTVSLAPGASRTVTFTASIGADASAGAYDATVETADDAATTTFEVVESEGGDDGGGAPAAGGGGGGGSPSGGGSAQPDGDQSESTNETTESTIETADPTNGTADPTNGTDTTNATDASPNGTEARAGDTDEGTRDGVESDGADGSADGGTVDGEADGGGSNASESVGVSDDSTPGFGPIAGTVALLSAVLFARSRSGDA